MKTLIRKLIAALTVAAVAGGIYVGHQNGYFDDFKLKEIFQSKDLESEATITPITEEEPSKDEIIEENIDASKEETIAEDRLLEKDEENLILHQMEVAQETFETNGMVNLYSDLKEKEKKKWTAVVNENQYFETADKLQFEISGLYEIADHQYYILGFSTKEGQEETPEGIFQLVLQEEDGQYFVSQASYPSEKILSSEELALYKKVEQEESNIEIEYKKVNKLNDLEEYVDYLDEAMSDLGVGAINDNGKSEVTQYVQYALEEISTESIVADGNKIGIDQALVTQIKEKMVTATTKFSELLEKNDVSFNKALNTVLRVQTEKTTFKKPIYIELPKQFDDLGDITGLRILFDENSYIYIKGTDLEKLAGYTIKIERLADKCTYEITFIDELGQNLEQIDASVTFAFPAKDELSTVIAHFSEESQNWGGQYDASTSVIVFGTKYSGTYEVTDNIIKIHDINHLPKSQQSAIKFMVAKGYLSLEDGYFYPESSFTRYEFAEALVKMFFALDTSLETTFEDVPKDSPYYPYVASGETYEIIKGYVDQTFKGDVKIPKEQVVSLCARTIADKKGYVYPESIEDYLRFVDAEEIAKWAVDDIALAVRSGLITDGGELAPKAEITKAESAEVLYQLFMLLYETAPTTDVVEWTNTQKTYSILGVFILLALAIFLIRRFIKRNKVILTMIACTVAIIITLIIGFSGGFNVM